MKAASLKRIARWDAQVEVGLDEADAFRAKVRAEAGWLSREVLGVQPWEGQEEIIGAVLKERRTAVSGCVGSSKTHGAAQAVIAHLMANGPRARAFTLAPSYRQVGGNLWGELKGMVRRSRVPLGGRLYEGTEWKFSDEWYALGFSTREPEMVHGIHGPADLLVVDDAHGLAPALWPEIENMMAGGDTRLLMLFNRVALAGPTHECNHFDAKRWRNISIPFSRTPNGKARAAVIPEMLRPEVAEEWVAKYGWESAFVRAKVRDVYPLQEADTLIPLDWVEAAFERRAQPGDVTLAVDVARFGDDRSVVGGFCGRQGLPPRVSRKRDLMELVALVGVDVEELAPRQVLVDGVGLGAGVVDRGRELGWRGVRDVNAGAPATDPERFYNLKSEMAWALRDALDPAGEAPVSLVRDADTQAELSAVKYRVASDKRIRVESKEDFKKRLGFSHDIFDMYAMAAWGAGAGRPASAQSPYSSLVATINSGGQQRPWFAR